MLPPAVVETVYGSLGQGLVVAWSDRLVNNHHHHHSLCHHRHHHRHYHRHCHRRRHCHCHCHRHCHCKITCYFASLSDSQTSGSVKPRYPGLKQFCIISSSDHHLIIWSSSDYHLIIIWSSSDHHLTIIISYHFIIFILIISIPSIPGWNSQYETLFCVTILSVYHCDQNDLIIIVEIIIIILIIIDSIQQCPGLKLNKNNHQKYNPNDHHDCHIMIKLQCPTTKPWFWMQLFSLIFDQHFYTLSMQCTV